MDDLQTARIAKLIQTGVPAKMIAENNDISMEASLEIAGLDDDEAQAREDARERLIAEVGPHPFKLDTAVLRDAEERRIA